MVELDISGGLTKSWFDSNRGDVRYSADFHLTSLKFKLQNY